jgi:hypothetical protein
LLEMAAQIAGGVTLMVLAGPAIGLPAQPVSAIPSAVSPGAAHAA